MSKWYCRICNKNLNSGGYCMESHFRRKHPTAIPREIGEGGKWNWNCSYMFPVPEKAKKRKIIKKERMKKGKFKEIRKLLSNRLFLKKLIDAMVISVLEFQLNWKHQIQNKRKVKGGKNYNE